MIIRSRKRSNSFIYVRPEADKVKEEKKVEKKVREKKVTKKEEEPILPLVEEALASVEE